MLSNTRSSSRPIEIVAVSNLFSLVTSHEVTISCQLLDQELSSLKRMNEDRILTTVDGTFIWKISGIQEKLGNQQITF
jgi:hypothetical protein